MIDTFHNKPAVVQELKRHHANIEAKHDDGATAWWLAGEQGHARIAQALLDNGADIESKAQSQLFTLLAKAAQCSHLPVVYILIERGANIESSNTDGVTALHETAWNCSTSIPDFLISKGANIGTRVLLRRNGFP